MLKPLLALALLPFAAPSLAGECEANFKKSGNPLVMTSYSSAVTVPNLSTRDALAQMRGIMVAEKMDVMAEDADGGTLLVEQRQSKSARPIPTTISVSEVASGTRIEMAVKMERGAIGGGAQRERQPNFNWIDACCRAARAGDACSATDPRRQRGAGSQRRAGVAPA